MPIQRRLKATLKVTLKIYNVDTGYESVDQGLSSTNIDQSTISTVDIVYWLSFNNTCDL